MEQSGHTVRAEDGVYGRPVSRVGFKHVFNQVVKLIGKVTGQRCVRPTTHFQNQTLPATGLKLKPEQHRVNSNKVIDHICHNNLLPRQTERVNVRTG